MANEKLTAVLGPDGMSELQALLKEANSAPLVPWQAWLMTMFKRWEFYAAIVIGGLPELIPLISPDLEQLMTPQVYKHIMKIGAVVIVLVKFAKIKKNGT